MDKVTVAHLDKQLKYSSKVVVDCRALLRKALKGIAVPETKNALHESKNLIELYIKQFSDALINYDNMHGTLKNITPGQWWVYSATTQEEIDVLVDKLKKVCHSHRVKLNAFNRHLESINSFLNELC